MPKGHKKEQYSLPKKNVIIKIIINPILNNVIPEARNLKTEGMNWKKFNVFPIIIDKLFETKKTYTNKIKIIIEKNIRNNLNFICQLLYNL